MIVVVVILEVFFYVLLFFALWFSDSHCKLCTCFLANGHCTCWLIISPARMTMTRSKNLKKRNKNWLYRMLNTLCQKKVIKSKPLDCKLSLVWLAFTHLFMHSILCKTSARNRQEIYSWMLLKYLSNNVQCKSGLLGNFSEVVSCAGSLYTFAAGVSSSRILTSTKQQE